MSDDQLAPAIAELKRRRQRANWSKLLLRPISLADGNVLQTLKDAALRILELPPGPSSRRAAEKIMDAACGEGDLIATDIAVRFALRTSSHIKTEPDLLKTLHAILAEATPGPKQESEADNVAAAVESALKMVLRPNRTL